MFCFVFIAKHLLVLIKSGNCCFLLGNLGFRRMERACLCPLKLPDTAKQYIWPCYEKWLSSFTLSWTVVKKEASPPAIPTQWGLPHFWLIFLPFSPLQLLLLIANIIVAKKPCLSSPQLSLKEQVEFTLELETSKDSRVAAFIGVDVSVGTLSPLSDIWASTLLCY